MNRGNSWWLVPSPGKTKIKGVPKAVPLNGLALEALQVGDASRIAGRPFERWKDANSFKHRWQTTCKRAGMHDVHFHDLRHTAGSRVGGIVRDGRPFRRGSGGRHGITALLN